MLAAGSLIRELGCFRGPGCPRSRMIMKAPASRRQGIAVRTDPLRSDPLRSDPLRSDPLRSPVLPNRHMPMSRVVFMR
jgi:hypothetical protein